MVGSYGMMRLFHMGWVSMAVQGLPIQPQENHLSVGCNELHDALILLYVLFLHNLNTSKAYSIIGSGHLIVFAHEVENWGTENVRHLKREGKKFKARILMNSSYIYSECPNQRLWGMWRAGLSSSGLLESLWCISIDKLCPGGSMLPESWNAPAPAPAPVINNLSNIKHHPQRKAGECGGGTERLATRQPTEHPN